jgi:phenylpropionate dioxygenase-like ring-hydroxylating dioxygenase large terminal subunit
MRETITAGTSMFLRNAWYVAAWADEVTEKLLPIEMLADRIVVYRRSSGDVVALEDACPHRKLPLSAGRLIEDQIICGYHGLTFDGTGTCVAAPTSSAIPPKAKVRSYATLEQYGLVWIWMGDADRADPMQLLEIANWGKPGWGVSRGQSMIVDCHYLYLVDNLLDPTHVTWVHPSSFGDNASAAVPIETLTDNLGVTARRWIFDIEPAPFYKKYLKFTGRCDRYQHYEVRYPSNAIIKAVFTPAGSGGKEALHHTDVFLMDSYNFLTPVNAKQTRYFWFQLRNFAPDDEQISRAFSEDVKSAFEEDRLILNAVQTGMDNMVTPNIDLKNDRSSFRFRKTLGQKIMEEWASPGAS